MPRVLGALPHVVVTQHGVATEARLEVRSRRIEDLSTIHPATDVVSAEDENVGLEAVHGADESGQAATTQVGSGVDVGDEHDARAVERWRHVGVSELSAIDANAARLGRRNQEERRRQQDDDECDRAKRADEPRVRNGAK